MGSHTTPRFADLANGRADERGGFVVPSPSETTGVIEALRSIYRVAGLPADFARLLAQLK